MSAQPETWRVSTVEGVFEADLETLRQWILEGCVQPTDKVTKGNMNWIEAGKAPMLRAAFAGERVPIAAPTAPAAVADFPHVAVEATPPGEFPAETSSQDVAASDFVPDAFPDESASPDVCHNHPQVATKYVCWSCLQGFCEGCARFVSNSKIPLCPVCGDLCKIYAAERSRVQREQFQDSGFGFADFARALRYPLQHKVALCFGAGLYGLMLLAGFRGRIVASVMMFGCISHVISNVAWGRLHKSFMPDFSEFSVWDDVAVPIGLGIGITIVTWGPAIVLILALIFGVVSSGFSPASALQPPAANSDQLNEDDLNTLLDPNADPTKQAEASKKLDQLRPGHDISREAERSKQELSDPLGEFKALFGYFRAPIVIVLLLIVAIIWGIFYYPMALAVAGYTQAFGSVINPLVGLDTIKRMGLTYFKAFGLVLLVQIVGGITGIVVAIILSPFALPFVGNLPAMFVDGSLTFYFNLVIACVLGLSLFKCADRLGIDVD